jgi:hypothetical protein
VVVELVGDALAGGLVTAGRWRGGEVSKVSKCVKSTDITNDFMAGGGVRWVGGGERVDGW